MGRKTCKSSRKPFLSYNPLIFPHLILVILPPQRFHPVSWGFWEHPELGRQARVRARCWHPWGAQMLAWGGCAGDSKWLLGCSWLHWHCVPQTLGIRKVAASMSCAPERSLISDLHTWKRGSIRWLSDANFHPTVKPLTIYTQLRGQV